MAGVTRLVAELDSRGLPSAATYLRNAGEEVLTVKRLRELKIVPELVMLAPSALERFARCLEEVRLNGTPCNSEADILTSPGERYTLIKGWFGGGVCGYPPPVKYLSPLTC